MLSEKNLFFLHFVYQSTATELHRDDTQLQNEITRTRQCMETYPNLYEAMLKSMAPELGVVEKDLSELKSSKENEKEKDVRSYQPDR